MMYSRRRRQGKVLQVLGVVKTMLKKAGAYLQPEALRTLAAGGFLKVGVYYDVVVGRTVEEAAGFLQLEREDREIYGVAEEGIKVFGDIEFGSRYAWSGRPECEGGSGEEDGEFDVNKPFIMLVDRCDWWGQQYRTEETSDEIRIYVPDRLIDEAACTAEFERRVEELCNM
jgi:predicted amidohydrolase YtcJ